MIAWLYPLGFLALAAVAVPILVHLLRRHRAPRVVVATVRFVPRLSPHAVRLRRPSDLLLLAVRIAVIVAAALACARPLFVTDARRETWNLRLAKAVVIDDRAEPNARLDEVLRAERVGSDPFSEIRAEELGVAIGRAANWLRGSPPARREIVVVSPLVHGTVTEAHLSRVPVEIGIRFVRLDGREDPAQLTVRALTPSGVVPGEARLDGDTSVVSYPPPQPYAENITLLAPPEHSLAVERLRRVVARAGAPAPPTPLGLAVRFRGGAELTQKEAPAAEAIAAAARLVQSDEVHGLPFEVRASGTELQVLADVVADSVEAATILHAALEATLDPRRFVAYETAPIPETLLRTWAREPATPATGDWRSFDGSDGRWLWVAALLLLGVETLIRRRRDVPAEEVHADAA